MIGTRRSALAAALLAAACGRLGSDGSRLVSSEWELVPGTSGETTFQTVGPLPDGTLSVTLLVEGGAPGDVLALRVRDAAGREWIEPLLPEESRNRMLRGRELGVAMLPSATAILPLGPKFGVSGRRFDGGSGEPPGPLRLSAFVKLTASDVPFTAVRHAPPVQALDTALLLVGDRVAEDDRLDRALGEAGRILRAAGIEVGAPARRRISGPEVERFERLSIDPALGSDSPELANLLRLGAVDGDAQEPPQRLGVYLVYDITVAGSTILGITGGVPVPPRARTARSGIAINSAVVEHDPIHGGQVMAHEIGHALGLYHTAEADGVHFDQIDDTGDEDDNLMRWAHVKGADRLTSGQAEILRRAALAR